MKRARELSEIEEDIEMLALLLKRARREYKTHPSRIARLLPDYLSEQLVTTGLLINFSIKIEKDAEENWVGGGCTRVTADRWKCNLDFSDASAPGGYYTCLRWQECRWGDENLLPTEIDTFYPTFEETLWSLKHNVIMKEIWELALKAANNNMANALAALAFFVLQRYDDDEVDDLKSFYSEFAKSDE